MDKKFDVDTPSAAVDEMAEHWPIIEALTGGTSGIRKGGKKFLPQWPMESGESYNSRLKTATLFPVFARTCSVMAAKPFSRPIEVDESIPAKVKGFLDDIDMYGTDLAPYAGQLMIKCLQYGLVGVLVDYPPVSSLLTKAEEKAASVRPYFTQYPAQSILGWRAKQDADGEHLLQLRLKERVTEVEGEFGERLVDQVRVLYPGTWEIWRKSQGPADYDKWAIFDSGTTTLDIIPFVFFYGIRQGYGIGAPPLLELAHMNVEHYQSASDQQTILHCARVPILFAKGFSSSDSFVVGASVATTSANEKADLSYVEHTGAAIEAGRQSQLDLEDRMRQTGAELLVQQPATATATQVVTEEEGNKSILQKIVEEFEESLESALELLGLWVNEPFEAEVEMYKDFGGDDITDGQGTLALGAAAAGHISSETVFEVLKRGDVIPHDAVWADELKKIKESPLVQRQQQELDAKTSVKKPAAKA